MNDSERDAEFEEFLKRRSPMHRRLADFDQAEPPAELDRLVLGRAREAIETPAQPPMFRASRWAMPAALAATILIAFTIVLNVEHQPRKPEAQVMASAPSPVAGAAENAGSAPDAVGFGATQAASPAEPAADRNGNAASARAEVAAPAAAPPLMAQERTEALAKRESTEQRAAAPVAEASGAPSSARTDAEPAMAAAASVADSAGHRDAETWLREIARLRAEGKNAAADRELAAFRRAYPSHSGTSLAQPPTR